jgi:hypothetical protein
MAVAAQLVGNVVQILHTFHQLNPVPPLVRIEHAAVEELK